MEHMKILFSCKNNKNKYVFSHFHGIKQEHLLAISFIGHYNMHNGVSCVFKHRSKKNLSPI